MECYCFIRFIHAFSTDTTTTSPQRFNASLSGLVKPFWDEINYTPIVPKRRLSSPPTNLGIQCFQVSSGDDSRHKKEESPHFAEEISSHLLMELQRRQDASSLEPLRHTQLKTETDDAESNLEEGDEMPQTVEREQRPFLELCW